MRAFGLNKLLAKLKIEVQGPMKLYSDNKAAINIAKHPVQHDRTKQVEIDRVLIKEKLESGAICMLCISSKEQLADVFTKGLSKSI